MMDRNKKCWCERVTAEIATTHVQQFAQEMGTNMSAAQVARFLGQNGVARRELSAIRAQFPFWDLPFYFDGLDSSFDQLRSDHMI